MADDSFDMETWDKIANDNGEEVKENGQPMINLG
jgi:hypothetical protein